jgi:hypothetical protein
VTPLIELVDELLEERAEITMGPLHGRALVDRDDAFD